MGRATRTRRAQAPAAPGPAEPLLSRRAAGVLALVLALFTGLVQWRVLGGLAQLPSPLFGGDYTYQMGCIRSILASWNPMASCGCSRGLPGYQPFYGTLVALAISATKLPVVRAMLIMSAVNHLASVLIVYVVATRHLGRTAGIVATALWAAVQTGPAVRYTEFAALILVPLYYDALLLYLAAPRVARGAYLGAVLAVLGYAHAVVFVAAIAITAIATAIAFAMRARDSGWPAALGAFALAGLIAALGASLALGYWYQPLFVHHASTSLHYSEWNGGFDLRTLGLRLDYAWSILLLQFKPWPPAEAVLHLLWVAGLVLLWRIGWRGRFSGIAIAALATCAWMMHFFVTMPLFHMHFVPDYVRRMVWQFAVLLTAGVALDWLLAMARTRRALVTVVSVCVALSLVTIAVQGWALAHDPATLAARAPLSGPSESLQRWVYANTSPDDVVLSTNELSFAWSALTGRKALVTRRAQNDPFMDMDERNKDAALILYGTDNARRRQLLQRWDVRYVLWTWDWTPSEFGRDSAGNWTQADPLLYFTNPEYEAELKEAGVQQVHTYSFVDPALRGPRFPRFELTLISPQNYQRPGHPWRDDLDSLMKAVWSYDENGVRRATLYRVQL